MIFSKLWWLAGLAVLGWSLAGCGTDDSPPVFQGILLEPVSLRFIGGQVKLQVQVNDDLGLTQVGGMVMQGNRETVALEGKQPRGEADQFSYEAVFQVFVFFSGRPIFLAALRCPAGDGYWRLPYQTVFLCYLLVSFSTFSFKMDRSLSIP